MDRLAFAGLVVGLSSVYYTMYVGQIAHLLLNKEAFILVAGGTLGATMLTFQWDIFRLAPRMAAKMFFPPVKKDLEQLVDELMRIQDIAISRGIDNIRNEASNLDDVFLKSGIRMLVEGLDEQVIMDELELELNATEQRHQRVISMFQAMGTYAPIFGMLGTLIGVIQVLRDLSDPEKMGTAMAIAITTTFYGIFAANFLFLPVAGKLEGFHKDEMGEKELVMEGILAIRRKELPGLMRRKLRRFLPAHIRAKTEK